MALPSSSQKNSPTHTLTQVTTTDTHNGAWVHLHVIHKATNIPLTYSSTYLPPQPDLRLLAIAALPARPDNEWIWAGDFNCLEAPERDASAVYTPTGGYQLAKYTAAQNLVDIWLHTHPHTKGYTRRHSDTQSTRIDRIYTTPSFLPHTTDITLLVNPISDHKALHLSINMSLHSFTPTPSWRFNNSLLQHPETDYLVHTIINLAVKQRGHKSIISWWLQLLQTSTHYHQRA